jgi:hypothetical protein
LIGCGCRFRRQHLWRSDSWYLAFAFASESPRAENTFVIHLSFCIGGPLCHQAWQIMAQRGSADRQFPDASWYTRFKNRHPELVERVPRSRERVRITKGLPVFVTHFTNLDALLKRIAPYAVRPTFSSVVVICANFCPGRRGTLTRLGSTAFSTCWHGRW